MAFQLRPYQSESINLSLDFFITKKENKTELVEQIQACPSCDNFTTIRSKLIGGKWQQVEYNPGEE